MNHISYAGQKLKIIRYSTIPNKSGYLYRVDKDEYNTYKGASIKFFALTERNTNSYAKTSKFLKKWEVKKGNQLILIDILDIPTREALAEIIGNDALDKAFPIRYDNENKVVQPETKNNIQSLNNAMYLAKNIKYIGRYSNSNSEEGNPDYDVLKALCSLGIVDGYYMEPVENFHSEIGLCACGLSKISLVGTSKSPAYIHQMQPVKKTRSRRFIKNNNNNNSNNNNIGVRASLFNGGKRTHKESRKQRKTRNSRK